MISKKFIYLNGVLNATADWVPAAFENSVPILVAACSSMPSAHDYLNGEIDELRIYGRALTPGEIDDLALTPCSYGAKATATVVYGFVVEANITDPGCGYTNAPLVRIVGGGGSGATAFAQVGGGSVTNIVITAAGVGYTSTPTIRIASPPRPAWLEVNVDSIQVVQHVVLGTTYKLQSSVDLQEWIQQGDAFVAESEVITNVFKVSESGKYFRLLEMQ